MRPNMRIRGILLLSIVGFLFSAQFWALGETQYLAIFIDGQRAGYVIHNRAITGQTVRTTETVILTINRFGAPVTMSTVESSIETTEGRPLGFEAIQDMSIWRTTMTGTVSQDSTVNVISVTGQLEQSKKFDWPEGALLAEGLRLLQEKKGLAEGTQYSAKVFSPSILQALDTVIKIGPKKEVELPEKKATLTEVRSTTNMFMAGNVESISYVDDELNAMKTQTTLMGMKLEMVACSKEYALSEAAPAEFMGKTFISSPKPLPGIESAKLVRYRIRPIEDAKDFKIPSNDNQRAKTTESGTVLVIVKPAPMPNRAKLGYRGKDPEVLDALKPNRFIQSDDEKIIKLAKEAVGETDNAAEAARKIESFVANYIESTSLSVGYASAAEVADSRQGDCSEFAVLTAALCRAVGIPARIVVGTAYVDEFMGYENVFGGHAWTEAYIGNRWVGLDAAFKSTGRGGYDAGHIALAEGSGELEDYFSLLFNIGQFKIEQVDVQR
jgi:hypothetical protein